MFLVRKYSAVAALYLVIGFACNAQILDKNSEAEALLHGLFEQMTQSTADTEKEKICESVSRILDTVLTLASSFDYPYDLLKNLGKVYSPDGNLRFYSWNLPYHDGTNHYYGYIQYKPENSKNVLVFKMSDKSDGLEDPESAVLNQNDWYGSLVYEIAQKESGGIMYYLLLCYDPLNLFVSRKVIDILYFKEQNELVMGAPVFQVHDQVRCRVIFDYSARAQMVLKWVPSSNMIVFDHLSPERPIYEGNFQFYGPDFSYDGFVFENGYWKLVEDIDIRNNPE